MSLFGDTPDDDKPAWYRAYRLGRGLENLMSHLTDDDGPVIEPDPYPKAKVLSMNDHRMKKKR